MTKNRVFAISKADFIKNKDKFLEQKNVALISILDSDAERLIQNSDRAITLFFDDIHPKTTMTLGSCMDYHAMDFDQSTKLVKFIKNIFFTNENFGGEIDTFVVHCTAGICRSGAVADFLRVVFDVDDEWFLANNHQIIPNDWVLDLMWMTWKMNN